MAAIDYDCIPESVRQRLLAATYKLAKELFKDPQVQKEYEIWLAERRAREQKKEQE